MMQMSNLRAHECVTWGVRARTVLRDSVCDELQIVRVYLSDERNRCDLRLDGDINRHDGTAYLIGHQVGGFLRSRVGLWAVLDSRVLRSSHYDSMRQTVRSLNRPTRDSGSVALSFDYDSNYVKK
jgi:hypothetical protein